MGKIKKILENELVGGTQGTDVYPVTSTKAVYNEDNKRLDDVLRRNMPINISTEYNDEHVAEVLTLSQSVNKVASKDRILGFQGKYLSADGWHTIIYTGDSLTTWTDSTKWVDLNDKIFNSISKNATFAGIATPTTNPGVPDGPIFYLATKTGVYSNFNGIELTEGEAIIFEWDNGAWSKRVTGFATQEKLTELQSKLSDSLFGLDGNVFTIVGKRYTTNGDIIDYAGSAITNLLPLSAFGNPRQNGIQLKSGAFRMYGERDFCVAVFFDNKKSFIGFSQLRTTFSTATPFPASEIPSNAVYVAFTALTSSLNNTLLKTEPGFIEKTQSVLALQSEEIETTKNNVAELRKYAENGFGGVVDGFDVFTTDNVFTLKGKLRDKTTGIEIDNPYCNITPLINLDYIQNSEGDIELKQGNFRGSSFGVAFFYNAQKEYIGYDGSTATYSTVTRFPSSLIPDTANYVSFLQYNNQSSVLFYTYNKPISKYDELKDRLGIMDGYAVVVTPNMTPKAFYQAVNAQMGAFAEANKTYSHSFLSILNNNFNYTWDSVLSIVSKNLRQDIGDVNTPINIVCENVNKALTERVYRFYDAKPLSSAERDASLTTGLNKGEPSVVVSNDGGTMHIYGNGQRISTTDGVLWTSPINIVKSDNGHTLHESVNYIDGLYYLISPRANFGGDLVLYTSSDGVNFEYKGKLFLSSTILDGEHPVQSWGNPYLIKNYGDGKFYLYIETQESGFSWRIHLVTFDDFSTENADGTIGARTIYENNPIIQRPFGEISENSQSAGNPDFFKIGDNRPIKVDNKYFMAFHSTHVKVAHLFRASSYDLIHWNIDGIMWDNRDQPSGGDETSGNGDACVIEFKGRTYLFYTHDINQEEKGIEHIKYTIDDRPLSELLKLFP